MTIAREHLPRSGPRTRPVLAVSPEVDWTGVAIAHVAAVVGRFVRHSPPSWVRVVAILAALLSLANVLYPENQLDEKRQEINQIIP